MFDFFVKSKKIIIEFNGAHVHPREERIEDKEYLNRWKHPWTKEGPEIVLKKDKIKIDLVKGLGYSVYILWSDVSKESNWDIINNMIKKKFEVNKT